MTRAMLVLAALAWSGCAAAPPPADRVAPRPVDSLATVWGDEYEQPYEAESRPVRGLVAEWVEGDARSARLDAYAEGARLRARSSPRGDTAMLGWRGAGLLREIGVGHVEPVIADGALAGEARASSDLRAPATTEMRGLRMMPSTSPWSAARGAGVVLAARSVRVGLGGCELRNAPTRRFGFASIEHSGGGIMVGTAAGVRTDAPSNPAVSWFASRGDEVSFAGAEVAWSDGQVRSVARLVAGEREEWSAIAVAGAGPAGDEPLALSRRERWGAAVERRDAWRWGASRLGVSSLTRRDQTTDVQRRRAFWDGVWRASPGARLELAARVTREESERRADGALGAPPAQTTADDWRARATLRTESALDGGWAIANAYRLEWVQDRSGRPGTVATWICDVDVGPLEIRTSTTARALYAGQVAYEPDAAPLAPTSFTAVGGRGASMTASLRLWFRRQGWLGATWSKRPPAEARVWVVAGARI